MIGRSNISNSQPFTQSFQWRRWLMRGLQVVLVILLVVFVGDYLADQWDQLREQPITVNWPVLILSQIVLTFGLAWLSVANWLVLRYMDCELPLLTVCRIFFISNIVKYLPGSIWALPGRMFLYQRVGVNTAKSVVAVFWEVLLMLIGAALVSLLGWRFMDEYLPTALLIAGVVAGVIGLAGLFQVIRSPSLQARVRTLPMPGRLRDVLARSELWLTLPQTLMVLGCFMLGWMIIGLSFSGMVYAVAPTYEASWWIELAGLYMGTWVVGFLIFFTPGGIGVRDVLIGLGISVILGDPMPAVIAILSRITWTIAEVTGIVLVSLLYMRVSPPDVQPISE